MLADLRAETGCTSLTEMFLKLSQIGPALRRGIKEDYGG
jgi:hypothetical protein